MNVSLYAFGMQILFGPTWRVFSLTTTASAVPTAIFILFTLQHMFEITPNWIKSSSWRVLVAVTFSSQNMLEEYGE
jgi:hypothetical protein